MIVGETDARNPVFRPVQGRIAVPSDMGVSGYARRGAPIIGRTVRSIEAEIIDNILIYIIFIEKMNAVACAAEETPKSVQDYKLGCSEHDEGQP